MPAPAQEPGNQKRGIATRQRLVAVTRGLLAEFDYHSITLDQVAAAAPVSKSSILWHFGSKEGLLTEALFDLFEEIDAQFRLRQDPQAPFDARLSQWLGAIADYLMRSPEAKGIVISLLFSSEASADVRARIREHWLRHVDAIRQYLSTPEQPVSASAAKALMAVMHGCYLQWHLNGRNSNLAIDLAEAVAALRFDPPATNQEEW